MKELSTDPLSLSPFGVLLGQLLQKLAFKENKVDKEIRWRS